MMEAKKLGRNQRIGVGFAGALAAMQFTLTVLDKMDGPQFNQGLMMVVVPIVMTMLGAAAYVKGRELE